MRKVWLRAAFNVLREEDHKNGTIFPGDKLVPPDIHGEYVSTHDYYNSDETNWAERLQGALKKTQNIHDRFIEAVTFDPEQRQRIYSALNAEKIIKEGERFTVDLVNDLKAPMPFSTYCPSVKGEQAIDSDWLESHNNPHWQCSGR
ncbi:hypothetical protein [Serratia fonticola]|uniref:hypothetical protein n=2 Tax=Serratia fonticola TaxID=47917 RepID=UPI001D0189EE|nr:hypothetical protein [Serratia fonticola]